jgi:DNA (cytosine-5)-methyltransferase 1
MVLRCANLHDEGVGRVWLFDIPGALQASGAMPNQFDAVFVPVASTGDGFDASEDGTGRGTPLVTAFSCKDHGADAGEIAPTLRSMGHDGSHPNGGGQVAVAFDARQSDVIQYGDKTGPLDTDGHTMAVCFDVFNQSASPDTAHTSRVSTDGGRQSTPHVLGERAVRRLTPRECERLQGFPDDFTLVTYRGKPACDGPRYKALGNSMAVPVMAWIGKRIAELSA